MLSTTDGRGPEGVFSQVIREPTLSDRVAGQITEAVMSGRLTPGQRLQSERELADEFGVSRTVIREAIRSLAAHGLVETRSGRGLQVAIVRAESITRSMALFLRGRTDIDYGKVHEVRSALEVEIAALAAQRATAEDIERLRDSLNAMHVASQSDDLEGLARADVDFHRGLATATHNDLFVVLLGSIDELMLEVRRNAFAAPGISDYAIGAHASILDCVERHAPRAALEAMREHLEISQQAWGEPEATDLTDSGKRSARPPR